MYEAYYGLRQRPFEPTADPRFVFLSRTHREALSSLVYGIRSHRGMTLLIGAAGTGKTTLIRSVLLRRVGGTRIAYVNNPTLSREELFEVLATCFNLGSSATASKPRFVSELEEAAIAYRQTGGTFAVIIDEAQSVRHDLMEELRLLTNLETATDKLISVVLSAQPELSTRMNQPTWRHLKQRVEVRCELRPFERDESEAYIAARLRTAGRNDRLVSTEAVDLIHERSRGIPGTINVICNNALINGFGMRLPVIDVEIVLEVCRDLDLPGSWTATTEPRYPAAPDSTAALGAGFARVSQGVH